ncbi:MAG: DUF2066 domain-containing protein [Magnetococcales bacterium]|nr:DUF2066 domain-containing protein [Magnetococcales bacterium]
MWLALLLVLIPATGEADEALYRLEGVGVVLPGSRDESQDARLAAMELAKKEAFQRLLRRMCLADERRGRDPAVQLKGLDPLIQRLVVRAEKRIPTVAGSEVHLVADITFDRQAVRGVLEQVGLVCNEIPYPKTLLLFGRGDGRLADPGSPGIQMLVTAGHAYGFQVGEPLGDMDDMINLSLEKVVNGDAGLLEWVQRRYQAGHLWVVELESVPGRSRDQRPAALSLVEVKSNGERRRFQVQASGGCEGSSDPQACLTGAMFGRTLQLVMDQWIGQHRQQQQPAYGGGLTLRVDHGLRLPRYAALEQELRKLNGVSNLRVVTLTAREAVLTLDYQGRHEQLQEALAGLGWRGDLTPGEIVVRLP